MKLNTRLPIVVLLLFILLIQSCAFKSVRRNKGIVYLEANEKRSKEEQRLNVFAPRNRHHKKPVLVYIYGGNWTSGKRSLYSFLGNRFARKGVVTVVIDYPKSPDANYKEMATDAAKAVKWVTGNIERYGGDTQQIFVAGHSAGGHLAALISTDNQYFERLQIANPIKGAILIDAAGLDMFWYMKEIDYGPQDSYLNVFTKDPETWKEASPIYHIRPNIPPMLILSGGRSYPTLISSNERFLIALQKKGIEPIFIRLEKKKHVAMITQFFNVYNPRYKAILRFMKVNNKK